MLPVSLELAYQHNIDLMEVLALLTYKASDVLGLNKGVIAKGADADLALVDLDYEWNIDKDKFHSKSNNTPSMVERLKVRIS